MAMNMSTVSATSQKIADMKINSTTPEQNTSKSINLQPQLTHSKLAATTSRTLTSAGSQLDMTRSREKALNMQRIQLAEQLSNERKHRTELEARLADLKQKVASITSSSEVIEVESAKLLEKVDSMAQQLESQATEVQQRDGALRGRISDLESKLEEVTKDLEQSKLNCDALQKAHDEAISDRDGLTARVDQLRSELRNERIENRELDAAYKKLEETHEGDMKAALLSIQEAHGSRETDLQQRLTRKGIEAKNLRRELDALRLTLAEAASKREAEEKELLAQTEEWRTQALQAKEELAESLKQQEGFDELKKSTMPFPQMVVICVDLSGSATKSIHEIKQAYRDTLHMIKLHNSDAIVAVVFHGCFKKLAPTPLDVVSDATFRAIDAVSDTGGAEDYSYCLGKAKELFEADNSKKLLILIGDGEAMSSNPISATVTLEYLLLAEIQAHSIVLQSAPSWGSSSELTMEDISQPTGGRVEYKETYLSALEEILRHEREQHFRYS
ncbi:hypothetical protein Hte_010588 [Hypoxylon texense]